jgi:hypothetical protein
MDCVDHCHDWKLIKTVKTSHFQIISKLFALKDYFLLQNLIYCVTIEGFFSHQITYLAPA